MTVRGIIYAKDATLAWERDVLMGKATRLQYRGQVGNGYECIALRYWQTDVVRWYRSLADKSNKWYSIDAQYDSRTTNDRIRAYTGKWTELVKQQERELSNNGVGNTTSVSRQGGRAIGEKKLLKEVKFL